MITAPDFQKKQIVFVFFNDGEKMAITNDNFTVRTADGSVKLQCTCYRLFLVFAIGNFSITSAVIRQTKKFGFYIACLSPGFRLNSIIGADKEGNTLLKRKQYEYCGVDIGRQIVKNKLMNQRAVLVAVRSKNEMTKEAISIIEGYIAELKPELGIHELMAYEGLAAKLYFRNHFNNVLWQGRQPRLKRDMVNSVLDIGYSLLFTFVDCLLQCYGFDTYVGVLHRCFYMRKSLVCDLVEPFRCLIDNAIKKAINLKQIKETDFTMIQGQWKLKYEHSPKYVKLLMQPLLERKNEIFRYIRSFYNAFMKGVEGDSFPMFLLSE